MSSAMCRGIGRGMGGGTGEIILSCTDRLITSVLYFLSWLSCPDWHVLIVLSLLNCPLLSCSLLFSSLLSCSGQCFRSARFLMDPCPDITDADPASELDLTHHSANLRENKIGQECFMYFWPVKPYVWTVIHILMCCSQRDLAGTWLCPATLNCTMFKIGHA